MSDVTDSAGNKIERIPQCSCGRQNSAGLCEHVHPLYEVRTFPQSVWADQPKGEERP